MDQIEKIKDYSKKSITEKIDSLHIDASNPLKLIAASKYYEELAKALRKKVNADAVGEVEKYEKGQCKLYGVGFSIASRPKYDYSANKYWQELTEEIDRLIEIRKEIESQLKSATVRQKPINIVDDNGEVVTFSPVPVTYTDSVNVKLP